MRGFGNKADAIWNLRCDGGGCAVLRASIWIEAEELREFERTGTDAHRLCTYSDGWVERFGADVLISYKNEVARDRLTTELALWALGCNFKFGRIFGRYLPKQNAEREAPVLLLGDSDDESAKRRSANTCCDTESISAPDIPSGSSSISARIGSMSGVSRRRSFSIVSPTPVRFPSRPRTAARRR